MAKEKVLKLSGDRELGAVTKRLSSGMFETSKGEKVPPLPGVAVGTKVRLVNSRFEIVEGKVKNVSSTEDAEKQKIAALEAKVAALEAKAGEKGSAVNPAKAAGETTGNNAGAPKVNS